MSGFMASYEQTINKLMAIPKFGNEPGFHRFYELAAMWHIDLSFFKDKTLHITGSNGKGSVTALTANLLSGAGMKVGVFTSPHLFRFNERIQVGNETIADDTLIELSNEVFDLLEDYKNSNPLDTVGAFEVFTLIAVKYFVITAPDVLVIEAGIGGRFDTTKCLAGRYAALVSLDYEHTALLGSSLEKIGYDKSDIVSAGSQLFLGDMPENIKRKILAYNRSKATKVWLSGKDYLLNVARLADGKRKISVTVGEHNIEAVLGLSGEFQQRNTAIAVALSLIWIKDNHPARLKTYLNNAQHQLSSTICHGRLEQISTSPKITIDVGHSPAAVVNALFSYAEQEGQLNGKNVDLGILVLGVSHNKNVDEIVKILSPRFSLIVCTNAHHRGEQAENIAKTVIKFNSRAKLIIEDKIEDAVKTAVKQAKITGLPIYVAGGLFLAVEFQQALMGKSPLNLQFF